MEKENLFGENLKWLRKRNDFTQEHIANALNIDRSTYAYYELGHCTPGFETLKKIKRIYGVSLDDLLTEDISEKPGRKGKIFYDLDAKGEKQVLIYFRSLGKKNRGKLLAYMKELTDQEKTDKRRGRKKPSAE